MTVKIPGMVTTLTSFDLDCQRCGACCAPRTDWPTYVHVTATERRRLPTLFAAQVTNGELATTPDLSTPGPGLDNASGAGSTPVLPAGVRCVALEGELGARVACQIHSVRPQVCRLFRAGSKACLEARAEVLGKSSPGATKRISATY